MEIILIMGYPASGKSSLVKQYKKTHIRLNRDEIGGTISRLAKHLQERIEAGGKQFVLDNTYPTIESRAAFIEIGKRAKIPVKCIWLKTSIEDAQLNACTRMVRKYGKILDQNEIKEKSKKDPNCFPVSVLFSYRRQFEKPSLNEGFSAIKVIHFVREQDKEYSNKALILDYDGTLRITKSGDKYPLHPEDIEILPKRRTKLLEYQDKGYILTGVSNQSGVEKKKLSYDDAICCFQRTNDLLGLDIDFRFCPHHSFPISCFCRKPITGLGVELIETYKLNPNQCIMVGDMTSDKTFANRCGFKFIHADEFFKEM